MVIKKYKSYECKGDQQTKMVIDCKNDWRILNNIYYQSYQEIMNMKAYRYNDEHYCYVSLTYQFNLNKW